MKLFSRHHTHHRAPAVLHPVRDWFLLLLTTLILILLSVGWNLWIFSQVTQGGTLGSAPSEPQEEIGIEEVTRAFEQRAAERERYQAPGRFSDPAVAR